MSFKVLLTVMLLSLSTSNIYASAISDAVEHPARPSADVKRDANRNPQAVLSFLGVRPGMKILDIYSTEGYYTELLARAVGDQGKVIAHNSKAYRKFMGQSIDNRYLSGRLGNVERIYAHPREIKLNPKQMDMVLMILIYHDLYVTNAKNLITKPDRINLIKQVYNTLKPGGILGIVDHAAPRNSDIAAATDWHRLKSSIVVEELKSYGFELIGEDTALRNNDDPKNISVFNKKVRRKTDRYILKFQKPLTL